MLHLLVCTSVIVAAMERRHAAAIDAIRSLEGPSTRSIFVEGELRAGYTVAVKPNMSDVDVAVLNMREATLTAYLQLSYPDPMLSTSALSHRFGAVTAICARERLKVGQSDRWILAEALALGVPVLTADNAMYRLAEELASSWLVPGVGAIATLVDVS